MDDDAVERRRGLLALEAPPRRFPGRKRVLAMGALLGMALWWAPEVWEAIP